MNRRYPITTLLQSPVGRIAERLLWRFGPYKRLTARLVWAELERGPGFVEAMARSFADGEAGRVYGYRFSDFPSKPCDSWRPDDPIQPTGWHHDGRRWRLNRDGGWFRDTSGFWRYNKPGEVGWQEQLDGSWRYDSSKVTI